MLDIGVKEPLLTLNNIKVSDHATKRLRERLNIKDTTYALKFVKDILKNGEYLGEHISGDYQGSKNHVYANNGTMVVLDLNTYTVITVMQKDDNSQFHDKLKQQYIRLGTKEIRKLNRREQTLHKRYDEYKLDYDVQVAILNKRMYKTRSKNVITECKVTKVELDSKLNKIQDEIRQVQVEKRKVAYSLSVFL